jgi:hypothetical protein
MGFDGAHTYSKLYHLVKDGIGLLSEDEELNEREEEQGIVQNLKNSYIHIVVRTTFVLPCTKMIQYLIQHINVNNRHILNNHGKCIGCFSFTNFKAFFLTKTRKIILIKKGCS